MINTQFEAYKIKRELKRSGIDYNIKRQDKNNFGEPTGELKVIGTVKCIYHEFYERTPAIYITSTEAAQTRSSKIPLLLCLYEDVTSFAINVGDIIEFNNKTFKVTGIINIQEWNIIADISLEVIDSGIPA